MYTVPKVYERVRNRPIENGVEVWRAIAGLEGLYEVSSFGKIRSLPREPSRETNCACLAGRILKTGVCPKGHERFTFAPQGKVIGLRVNRVVATAFLPNPLNLPYVRHKDTNKLNNRVENLEWTAKRQKATGKEGRGHV